MSEEEKKLNPQEAQDRISEEYVHAMIMLTILKDPELKELNYIKTAVEFPNGGKYLLSFLHVDGPKIDLDQFRQPTDLSEKGKQDV